MRVNTSLLFRPSVVCDNSQDYCILEQSEKDDQNWTERKGVNWKVVAGADSCQLR